MIYFDPMSKEWKRSQVANYTIETYRITSNQDLRYNNDSVSWYMKQPEKGTEEKRIARFLLQREYKKQKQKTKIFVSKKQKSFGKCVFLCT